jgi:hypothetical protein
MIPRRQEAGTVRIKTRSSGIFFHVWAKMLGAGPLSRLEPVLQNGTFLGVHEAGMARALPGPPCRRTPPNLLRSPVLLGAGNFRECVTELHRSAGVPHSLVYTLRKEANA